VEGGDPPAVSPILAEKASSSQQSSPRRQKNKCVKNKGEAKLVLGVDISELEVVDMADSDLVGMACGRHFNIKMLKEWEDHSWTTSLGKAPSVQTLNQGWFCFKFRSVVEGRIGFFGSLGALTPPRSF
jgi:hypothetical protein